MTNLADDLIGEIRLGRGPRGPRPEDIQFHKAGRRSGGSRFSGHARNLWRVSQGSNAAIFKQIRGGGTLTGDRLRAQFDYLFGKSEHVFGNMVGLEPGQRGLTAEQRKEVVQEWSDAWEGDPKNGHTSHLLLSFPDDLAPEKALTIAETWATEMFQSGEHGADEWAYVAALHTDRPHPHVHIVVNNRGLEYGEWFYMAKDHVFNLAMMKERVAEIASEMHVDLDVSSRLERGILTYGPTRAQIELARRLGQPVHERMREGKALEDGLAVVTRSAATLRLLSSIASLSDLHDIATRMGRAASVLEKGGIITPKKLETMNMDLEKATTRRELDDAFTSWLDRAESQITRMEPGDRREMRAELNEISADIIRDLGDAKGADLVTRGARSEIYRTQLDDAEIRRGKLAKELDTDAADKMRSHVFEAAESIGISREAIERRLEAPAANAWQEREWVKSDLQAVSMARGLDLDREDQRHQAADLVDRFYASAAKTLNTALDIEHSVDADRLVRTLDAMVQINDKHHKVEFEHEDHAARFADDLRARYGDKVVHQLAAGDDSALALDFADAKHRREIARAVVAAADNHESIGLTRREIELARERLHERNAHESGDKVHELRRKDHDLEL